MTAICRNYDPSDIYASISKVYQNVCDIIADIFYDLPITRALFLKKYQRDDIP